MLIYLGSLFALEHNMYFNVFYCRIILQQFFIINFCRSLECNILSWQEMLPNTGVLQIVCPLGEGHGDFYIAWQHTIQRSHQLTNRRTCPLLSQYSQNSILASHVQRISETGKDILHRIPRYGGIHVYNVIFCFTYKQPVSFMSNNNAR